MKAYKKICDTLSEYQQEKQKRFANICNKLNQFYKQKEQMKLRGFNDFNFIDLLKGYFDENTHSKIIAELLDPQGSHYQGRVFLDNFLETVGLKNSLDDVSVTTERFIECEDGRGRIDIFLESENEVIIVENKIDAGEQESQIQKYVKCIQLENKDKPKRIIVLYLTKEGHHPSGYSLGDIEIKDSKMYLRGNEIADFINISYAKEILIWIEKNLADIENISNLREIILQYQKAVKVIIQKEENKMNLQDFLLKEENKDILIDLIENYEEFIQYINKDQNCKNIIQEENLEQVIKRIKSTLRHIVAKSIVEQLKKYAKENNFEMNENEFANGVKHSPLNIYKKEWLMNEETILSFSIENGQYDFWGEFYYGIRKRSEKFPYKNKDIENKNLKALVEKNPKMNKSNWWVVWKSFELQMYENEFCIKVLKEGEEKVAVKYVENFIKFIEKNFHSVDQYIIDFKKSK